MNFLKFSEWVSLREEVQAPAQAVQNSSVKKPIDIKTNASIKKKIAKASQAGKFNKAQFIKDLEQDPLVDPKAMIDAVGGGS